MLCLIGCRLKKAYRKKALELHPDRNHGDTERTTSLFAEIQSAYEVLSDDQERAWYDAHEGDILRGGSGEGATEDHYQGNMRMTTSVDLMRMMGRFRGNMDFSDSPSGFYGFVRETFEQLAKEEEYAADYEDINIPNYPTFGHKDDTHDDVVKDFYATWNGFASVKSYAWMDVFRPSDAPDRRTRRIMEKENQKLRDDGRREFNEAVRTLVAFVRKRDPRYTPNTQSADDKAKAQRDATKAQAARARAAQIAKLEKEAQALPSWATARHASDVEEESEEEVEEDVYECVACNKTFKSERQYDAHERSKKHQKAIQALKWRMQKDNAHLDLDKDGISSGVISPADDVEDDITGGDSNDLDESIEDITAKAEELKVDEVDTDEHGEDDDEKSNDKPNEASEPPTAHPTPSSSEPSDDEYAPRSTIEARLANPDSPNPLMPDPLASQNNSSLDSPTAVSDSTPATPKLGAAKLKKAKKAAKQADVSSSEHPNKCMGCDASFPSKTRLHQHLEDHPKHAALKSVGGEGKRGKKGKR
jgi:DnaJ family protein A protein 5